VTSKSLFLALVVLLLLSSAAHAQQVVTPNTRAPLSPEKAKIHTALVTLRDSLLVVQTAGGRLERDLRNSSDAVLRSRARTISGACASSSRAAASAQQTVSASPEPVKDPKKTRQALLASFKDLRAALDKCTTDFTSYIDPAHAEDLRGYGVSRSSKTEDAIQRYGTPLQQYLGAVDIVIDPELGVRPSAP
jgi:hypothetical protein